MALARRSTRSIRIRVPLSTSNVGPGFDAFGVALNLPLEVRWTPSEETQLERAGALDESVLPLGQDPVLRGLRRAAILAGKALPKGELRVSCNLPPGRGLGASGAGLIAGLLLGDRLLGGKLDRAMLLEEAISLEGHPENVTASQLGGAHWSLSVKRGRQESWIHLPVSVHRELRFLLVIPPYPMTTQRAREVLPTSVSFARAAAQARRPPILLEGLRKLDEDCIRAGIEDDLHVSARLKQLTGMETMAKFAVAAGALGVTLSGAGSALLVLSRMGQVAALEARLAARTKRLWGEAGRVVTARVAAKGAAFS